MSAIWGIIGRNETPVKEQFQLMTDSFSQYKIDRIDTRNFENGYMGCGHQYFTPESLFDVSPIADEESGILFSADCFLYNRESLFQSIKDYNSKFLVSEDLSSLGDAKLAFYAFKTFGFSFVDKLRGSFAVAIFDPKEQTLHLYTDHLCKRYLAYHICSDYIIFASSFKPLLATQKEPFKISERFIVNSYHNMANLNFIEYGTTIFEGVYHLDASMHFEINISTGEISKHQYWNPRKDVKKLKLNSDEAYKELFLKTYEDVAVSHLRSRKETGIMLSGGLDSASVLAMSAPFLKKQGKKIYSYTSVPCSTFKSIINSSVIEDETFLIREQQNIHSNLEPRFVGGETDNVLDYLDLYQRIFDVPVKAAVNSANIINMIEMAKKDDCLMILTGSNGNASISYGYASNYIGLSLEKLHFAKAFKEANKYCSLSHIPKRDFFKNFVSDIYSYFFKNRDVGESFVNKEMREKYKLDEFRIKKKKELGSAFYTTEQQKRNYMYIPMQYIQKSYYYTVLSLEYGIFNVDPTLSVEIVELCMSLPNECFMKNGVERRLIRDYMKDLLPSWITDIRKGCGKQASDFNFRINRDWDRIKDSVLNALNEPMLLHYFEKKELEDLESRVISNEYNLDWNTAWFLVQVSTLSYFLRGHKDML